MRAIILAAGRGSRMQGLTEDRPKCLVSFRGRTLLDWQVSAIKGAGITDIGIVTGYRRELLANRMMTEFHNERWAATNMVSSLSAASAWLDEETCLVSYSDIIYEVPAVSLLRTCQADLAITYDPNWLSQWSKRFAAPLSDAETFRLHGNGTLAEIGHLPQTVDEIEGQFMGLLRFTPRGWAEIRRLRDLMPEAERDRMHMTGTLQRVLEAGHLSIAALPYAGFWSEFDSESDLEAVS